MTAALYNIPALSRPRVLMLLVAMPLTALLLILPCTSALQTPLVSWLPGSLHTQVVPSLNRPVVVIGRTAYEGLFNPTTRQDFFGGIPFAAPPIGDLRFARPVPYEDPPDLRTVQATRFGAACIQSPGPALAMEDMSEDCLTLNVQRPAGPLADAALPVIVYVYGGGFSYGSASGYNASAIVGHSMARGTPIVFVTINYRLGPWGFPQGDAAHAAGVLNLALRDQQLAFRWVAAHIGAFGGDAAKVTVMGQSAGAISTSLHLLNPESSALFRGAILHSGAPDTIPPFAPSVRGPNWDAFATRAGCAPADLACLRAAPLRAIVDAHNAVLSNPPADQGALTQFAWGPTLDGDFVADAPAVLLSTGRFKKDGTGIVLGATLDEGTIFTPWELETPRDVARLLERTLRRPAPAAVRAYSRAGHKSPYPRPALPAAAPTYTVPRTHETPHDAHAMRGAAYGLGAAVLGDALFHGPRRALSDAYARAGAAAWSYHFIEPRFAGDDGVHHGIDLYWMFGGASARGDTDDAGRAFAAMWWDYWVAFAAAGDPNAGPGARPRWDRGTVVLELCADAPRAVPDAYRAREMAMLFKS